MTSANEFLDFYLNWGQIAEDSFKTGSEIDIVFSGPVEKIVFCGMGGSGIAGSYAKKILENSDFTGIVESLNDYTLPSWIDEETLVIGISFSGNTWETVKCVSEAIERNSKTVVVSRGGILGEMSKKTSNMIFLKVPEAPAPRAGLPNLLYTILGFLNKSGIIKSISNSIIESIDTMKKHKKHAVELAKEISSAITSSDERNIVVITGSKLAPVAIRAKNEFAENAKLPVYMGILPESAHNDIEVWAKMKNPNAVLVYTGDSIQDKMLDNLINTIKISKYIVLKPLSEDYLTSLMWPTWTLGLASVKTAINLGINPVEINTINRYKALLKNFIDLKHT